MEGSNVTQKGALLSDYTGLLGRLCVRANESDTLHDWMSMIG